MDGWMITLDVDGWIGLSVILLKDLAIRASLQILLRNEVAAISKEF